MAIRSIPQADGERSLTRWISDRDAVLTDPGELALAVRFGLQLLREKAPGKSVEVRVPPFGAVQVIEGPQHTRGTPPAVVEMSAQVWLDLITGLGDFSSLLAGGAIHASGLRTDLQGFLPLWPLSSSRGDGEKR
ncbi:MAG: sterol carrier family protein [Pontimonas sp.]